MLFQFGGPGHSREEARSPFPSWALVCSHTWKVRPFFQRTDVSLVSCSACELVAHSREEVRNDRLFPSWALVRSHTWKVRPFFRTGQVWAWCSLVLKLDAVLFQFGSPGRSREETRSPFPSWALVCSHMWKVRPFFQSTDVGLVSCSACELVEHVHAKKSVWAWCSLVLKLDGVLFQFGGPGRSREEARNARLSLPGPLSALTRGRCALSSEQVRCGPGVQPPLEQRNFFIHVRFVSVGDDGPELADHLEGRRSLSKCSRCSSSLERVSAAQRCVVLSSCFHDLTRRASRSVSLSHFLTLEP